MRVEANSSEARDQASRIVSRMSTDNSGERALPVRRPSRARVSSRLTFVRSRS